MNASDLAIGALAVSNLAIAGLAAYIVRRVSPWPKPPAPPQSRQAAQGGPVPPGGIQ